MRAPVLALWLLIMTGHPVFAGTEHTQEGTITVDGRERTVFMHVPPSYQAGVPTPFVLAFHGGGGDARGFEQVMRLSTLSDQHGFLVAYPEAIDGHWNDGREAGLFAEHDSLVDDVQFVLTLIDALREDFTIDTTRIFAVGVSNGGMFVQRLAIEHAERFAGIASVISSIPEPLKERFHPSMPMPTLFINGTADPFVPYEGGEVKVDLIPGIKRRRARPDRGRVLSTDESIRLWIQNNKANDTRLSAKIPDHEPRDGATVDMFLWTAGEGGSVVYLYKVNGGGHTIPGGSTGIPPRAIFGNICTDFDASEAVWLFFKNNARK